MTSVPQHPDSVEFMHRGLAVECGTVEVLLTLLRHSATILLMQVERVLPHQGTLLVRRSLHLTARKIEQRESPVYYGTITAVQFLRTGNQGRIIFPYHEKLPNQKVTERATELTDSLQASLITALEADARVSQVLVPARYRLPDEWVWSVKTGLEGTPITFQQGRWCLPDRS